MTQEMVNIAVKKALAEGACPCGTGGGKSGWFLHKLGQAFASIHSFVSCQMPSPSKLSNPKDTAPTGVMQARVHKMGDTMRSPRLQRSA